MNATSEQSEIEVLRRRLTQLEAENAELAARANAAVAAAQDKAYWLDRWGLDLNRLMERKGAEELRTAVRGVRGIYRRLVRLKRRLMR
jgi:hypothetical protein